jgi:hypothetical protein
MRDNESKHLVTLLGTFLERENLHKSHESRFMLTYQKLQIQHHASAAHVPLY